MLDLNSYSLLSLFLSFHVLFLTVDFQIEMERVNSEHLQRETGPTTPMATRYPSHDNNNHNSNTRDDNIAATPPSSGKFISRQLQDLDGLINQRRLELSELKKANRQRLDATPAPTSSGGSSRGGGGGGTGGGGGGTSGFETAMSPAVVSLSRVAYEELKETERTLQSKLKAEQLRANQLEDAVADLENQCAGHAERAKGAVGDRNR